MRGHQVLSRSTILLVALVLPRQALAHAGLPPAPHDLWSAWSLEPWIVIPMVLASALYAIGTTLGMSMLAGAAGPLLARAGRKPTVATMVVRAAGALSVILGIAWTARTIVELAT